MVLKLVGGVHWQRTKLNIGQLKSGGDTGITSCLSEKLPVRLGKGGEAWIARNDLN